MNLEEICQKLSECKSEPIVTTIPDIFGMKEPDITRWLAYLLDPAKNGIGLAPLNQLLQCVGFATVPESETVAIRSEKGMNGKRIDLFVVTQCYIIGIEVKLDADEQQYTNGKTQTEVYWEAIRELAEKDKKTPVGIFLKEQSAPECDKFKHCTYTMLVNAWKEIPFSSCQERRKQFLFDEFILYAEKKIIGKTSIPEKYLKYADAFDTCFYHRFSGMKLCPITSAPHIGWWAVMRNRYKGKGIWTLSEFHFEILWDSERLFQAKKLYVAAHLDPSSKNENLREALALSGFSPDSDGKGTILERTIPCDFSTKETTLDTIKKIKKRLTTGRFKEAGDIADKIASQKK